MVGPSIKESVPFAAKTCRGVQTWRAGSDRLDNRLPWVSRHTSRGRGYRG